MVSLSQHRKKKKSYHSWWRRTWIVLFPSWLELYNDF
jgi:hypothetical protein